jgi:hypothetical protein
VIVSAAPMFGVKLIEVVQKIATLMGQAPTVDARTDGATAPPAACSISFRHSRTPGNYVILPGDVHHSFAYDVEVCDDTRLHIWQITSSGFKNEFRNICSTGSIASIAGCIRHAQELVHQAAPCRSRRTCPISAARRAPGRVCIGQVWSTRKVILSYRVALNADGRPSTQFLAGREKSVERAVESTIDGLVWPGG